MIIQPRSLQQLIQFVWLKFSDLLATTITVQFLVSFHLKCTLYQSFTSRMNCFDILGTCFGPSKLPSFSRQQHWTGLKQDCRCAGKDTTC